MYLLDTSAYFFSLKQECDFIVQNEGKRTICRGNLKTGEEIFPLSEERASELEVMNLERERLLHRKHEPSHNGHHISSHNIELI